MIDREKMDADIVAAVSAHQKAGGGAVSDEDRAIYRAGVLYGMRAAADLVDSVPYGIKATASLAVRAAAAALETEK